MKKLLLLSVIGLVGCGTNRTYIQHGDKALVSGRKVYFIDCDLTREIIKPQWDKGSYGDSMKVFLVDTATFRDMCKKAAPCGCSPAGTVANKSVTKT
jgi:hypothetical protein